MHANACNCVALSVHFSGVVLYLRSQYMNFTFKKIQNGKNKTFINYLTFLSQSVSPSVRWTHVGGSHRVRGGSPSARPDRAGQLEHDRYCAAANSYMKLPSSAPPAPPTPLHPYASDDDRSASSINANAHLMHIFRSLSPSLFPSPCTLSLCHSRLVFLLRIS